MKIAVIAERSSAYGRNFICGIAGFAADRPQWEYSLVEPNAAATGPEYDGYICRSSDERLLSALARSGRPVVDCLCALPNPRFASVRTDADAIGRLAAEHFLSLKFPNVAFCGYRRIAFSDRRRNAFAGFLEKYGMRPSIYRPPMHSRNRFGSDFLLGDRVETPPDADDLAAWLSRLPKPCGVFCCDDLRASQVLAMCRSQGLAVPGDVAILGVDDDPVYCMFSSPRLSSIDPGCAEIGRVAAAALAEMLADPAAAASPPSLTVPPRRLEMRDSTNHYPCAPCWFASALAYIRENAAKGISASDVFRHVGLSRTPVEKGFRDAISRTVQQEISEMRLAEAKRLLSATFLPVKEVAARSGFTSLEYFSRVFAAAAGVSPSAWRERNAVDV